MIDKKTYSTSKRYYPDGYSFEAPETEYLLNIIRLERKHRDILDMVEDKLMEVRDTNNRYIFFDCPKKDYDEVKEVLEHYGFAYWIGEIEKKNKNDTTYRVKLAR